MKVMVSAFLLLAVSVLASEAAADALCNGNALAGPRLRPLTVRAATATLRAAADTYRMLSFVEEGQSQLAAARSSGESALKELRAAIETLQKDAADLPEAEFSRMTEKFKGMNFDLVAGRIGVVPQLPVWEQIVSAAKAGGRGWLGECTRSKQVLHAQTEAFVKQLWEPAKPAEVWKVMNIWSQELSRQRLLTVVLYE
jgi:hypothetical protein